MLRTIIVTIAGVILSLLLASVFTYLILNHTQFGHLAMGDTRGISSPWKTFMNGFWILFSCVSLPTATLVAAFVGVLAKEYASIAATIAVLPIALVSSGLELREAWVAALLVITAILVATSLQRLRKVPGAPRKVLNS